MNLAVIGAGYWGINLVRVFRQLGVLHRVCDFSAQRLDMLQQLHPDIRLGNSIDEVPDDSSIDVVVIATPAESHYGIASRALLAGKDVFCEKPLTLHCHEAENLTELAARLKRVLMVGHLLEYHPAITRLQQLIEQGELGRLEYIYSNRFNLGKVRREENAPWSFAPHDISVILLLMKQMSIQVSATGGPTSSRISRTSRFQPCCSIVVFEHIFSSVGCIHTRNKSWWSWANAGWQSLMTFDRLRSFSYTIRRSNSSTVSSWSRSRNRNRLPFLQTSRCFSSAAIFSNVWRRGFHPRRMAPMPGVCSRCSRQASGPCP